MSGRMLPAGRLAGIPLRIHPLWFVVVVLFTVVLGASDYPAVVPGIAPWAAYALGLASVLGLFACVIAHEFGHALVARRDGVKIDEIDLWPLGGLARMSTPPPSAAAELRMALAGPAVSVVLAIALGAAAFAIPRHGLRALHEVVLYLAEINVLIAVLNLVPALPLDGGRVAHAVIWSRGGDRDAATVRAASGGRWFGWFFVAIGVLGWLEGAPAGLWLALIGWFVIIAAGAEARAAIVHHAFGGIPAARLMTTSPVVVAETATVQEALERIVEARHPALPVVASDGRVVGLVLGGDLGRVGAVQRRATGISALVRRDPELLIAPDADVGELLERRPFVEIGRAVVVDPDGRPAGIVSVTDVERTLRGMNLLDGRADAA